ncbi:uncharacterized protein TRAVEDRAFT_42540 [Trametes versicolor FP-101664 SS1]|uniref:uncharacterized protein n=1 Tax=Trametes versicolor (strain FP-101664) TaxID=717944 RepID=UPI0004621332|nr:uncharacterized protein TRAVEDRAFT_42540 [Trametes versicolor FP-101664 SS1]EIW65161.1 hypothetical protein TRAVEDRAFT_42540 [Trametes versicolor FP-101664 SS1]
MPDYTGCVKPSWVPTDGGDAPLSAWPPILREVETNLSRKIVLMERLHLGSNPVIRIQYEDGEENVARNFVRNHLNREEDIQTIFRRFRREIHLMEWLKANDSAIPGPTIIYPRNISPEIGVTFVILDKLPGELVVNVFGRLPYLAKARLVLEHADKMLALFRLSVPQRIGSPICGSGGTVMDVGPWCPADHKYAPTKVFNTLEEWISDMIQTKARILEHAEDTTPSDRSDNDRVLARLTTALSALCTRFSLPSYRRCVLNHDELYPTKILVSAHGALTGIVDWEYTSIRPALLAAQYPSYLRYDHAREWYVVNPQDAQSLRDLYRAAVELKDPEYWEALVDGENLRYAVELLTHDTFGYHDLETWMDATFSREKM